MLRGSNGKKEYTSFLDMYNKMHNEAYDRTHFEKSMYLSIIALDTVNNAPRTKENYKQLNNLIKAFELVHESKEGIINKDRILYKFIVAAAEDGEYNIVKFFLEAGVDPNIKLEGKTSLQVAAENIGTNLVYETIVKLLISKGADKGDIADNVLETIMSLQDYASSDPSEEVGLSGLSLVE